MGNKSRSAPVSRQVHSYSRFAEDRIDISLALPLFSSRKQPWLIISLSLQFVNRHASQYIGDLFDSARAPVSTLPCRLLYTANKADTRETKTRMSASHHCSPSCRTSASSSVGSGISSSVGRGGSMSAASVTVSAASSVRRISSSDVYKRQTCD